MTDTGPEKLHTLKIREEYRQLVLPYGAEAIAHMEEQIRRFGCGDPISVWGGRLLVDYDRYAIFHRLHIPFRIKNNAARNSEEVIEWICRNQLQRRDLTDAMRRYLIGRQFLALKLLGAHYAASMPSTAGKRRDGINYVFNGQHTIEIIALMITAYGDSLRDDLFQEKVGKFSSREISRSARERKMGSMGYAEVMLAAYNKKTRYPLRWSQLHELQSQRVCTAEEDVGGMETQPASAQMSLDHS